MLPAPAWPFIVYQRRRCDAMRLQRWQQVGQEMLHATGEWRVVLADVQDAYRCHSAASDAG
jgi:hypothetical protein